MANFYDEKMGVATGSPVAMQQPGVLRKLNELEIALNTGDKLLDELVGRLGKALLPSTPRDEGATMKAPIETGSELYHILDNYASTSRKQNAIIMDLIHRLDL